MFFATLNLGTAEKPRHLTRSFTGENACQPPLRLHWQFPGVEQKEESSAVLFGFTDVLAAESQVIGVCVREIERGIFLTQLEPGEMACN